jgi:hypothetical protein
MDKVAMVTEVMSRELGPEVDQQVLKAASEGIGSRSFGFRSSFNKNKEENAEAGDVSFFSDWVI